MAEVVTIQFQLDAQGNVKGFKKFEGQAKKSGEKSGKNFSEGFSKNLKGIAKTASKIAGVLTTVLGGITFAKSIKAAQVQEDAINALNTSLLITGKLSNETSLEIQKFASALQQQSKFGDEAILSAAGLIQTLSNLDKQGLKRATAATADFAAALNIDLNSAASLVGKALSGQTGALGRYGVSVKKGRTEAETLANTLTALESKFGGTAQQQISTFSGVLQQTSNTFGDLLEEIGFIITRQPLVVKLIKAVGDQFSQSIKSVKEFSKNLNFFQDVIEPIFRFNQAFIEFVIAPFELLKNVSTLAVDNAKLQFQALIASLGFVGQKFAEFFNKFGLDNKLTQGLQAFGESSAEVFEEFAQNSKNSFQSLLDFPLSQGLAQKNEETLNTIRDFNNQLAEENNNTAENIKANVDGVAQVATDAGATLTGFLTSFNVGFNNNAKSIAKASQQLTSQFKAGLVKGISGGIQTIISAVASGENAFKAFGKFILTTIGDLAIQLGQTLISAGIGIESLKSLGGGAAIAAGAALVAIGSLIKSFVGGGGGSTAGGGGNVGAAPAADNFTAAQISEPDDIEERQTGPKVQLVVQGDILDSEQTSNRILDLLNQNFSDNNGSLDNASFA